MLKILIAVSVCLLISCQAKKIPISELNRLGDFKCPSLPPHNPTNISNLHPNDIKVVMSLGDSITAGFGIKGIDGLFDEYRGLSWDIGGDSGAITLPNFLKYFNPDLQGAANGYHLFEFCYGEICPGDQYRPTYDVLNGAQSGAMAMNLPQHELDYIISQLNANPNIDMQKDWKMLTLLIGANDLCLSCDTGSFLDPQEFEDHIFATLERIRTEIPRTFVNLVPLFNISQVYNLSLQSPYCADMHRVVFIECDCIFGPFAEATRKAIDSYVVAYNQRLLHLESYYKKMNAAEFAVVIQPFLIDTSLANQPIQILSTLDCFHPSQFAHEMMAIALWNSILTPAAKKATTMNEATTPICPTADTLLYTW